MENKKTEQVGRAPVYVPFKTFMSAIEILEQGVPDPLDGSVWSSWSGGARSQTLGAFKFLGLIDEKGNVQPTLRRLTEANGEDRKVVLKEIIEERYREAIKLGEGNSTFQQLQEFFRQYGIGSGTLERAIRFFLDACDYSGLKCSVHWANAKKSLRPRAHKENETAKGVKPKLDEKPGVTTQQPKNNLKMVQLKNGAGSVELSLSVDLTKLVPEDWEWLQKLINSMSTYGMATQEQK